MKKKLFLIPCLFILSSCSLKESVVKASNRNATYRKPVVKVFKKDDEIPAKYTAEQYIERFRDIAIEEMKKNGIPASITLAQGLLESASGNSTLAREANNHFGIKCTSAWSGPTMLKDDDAKDECFRVYSSPEESYRDHSEFLKRKHYAFLFELDRNDYTGWAKGLKQAGYATNPKYPELLINLIERYHLDQYDREETVWAKARREEKVFDQIAEKAPQEKKIAEEKSPVAMKIHQVKQGETLFGISKRYGLTVEEIRALNGLEGADIKLGQLLLVSK